MRFNLTLLEERIVLDAAGALEVLNSYHLESVKTTYSDAQSSDGNTTGLADSSKETSVQNQSSASSDQTRDSFLLTDGLVPSSDGGTNIIVISSAVDHSDILAAAAKDPSHVIIYDASHTSLDQLASKISTMLGGQKADTIAFINNGSSGAFALTSDVIVSLESLQANPELQAFWDTIGLMVKDQGQINLLACNVASTSAGVDLVNQIQNIADEGSHHVQVDASSDLTGNSLQGGDWNLELGNVQVGSLYFTNDLANWDGHLAAAHIVSDIIPGAAGSSPSNFLDSGNGTLYFTATGPGDQHATIWKSTGVAAGTEKVLDINPSFFGTINYDHFTATNVAGAFFFTSNYVSGGTEHNQLWAYSPIVGATMIQDFGNYSIDELVRTNNTIYLAADNGSQTQLWRRDGSSGTLALLFTGSGPASVSEITVASDRVYFFADNGIHGKELWVTDGISSNSSSTFRLTDISSGDSIIPSISTIVPFGDRNVYFNTKTGGVSATVTEIWRSNGTVAGTTRVVDMKPQSHFNVNDLAWFNNKLYFSTSLSNAAPGTTGNNHLWSYDGSTVTRVYSFSSNLDGFNVTGAQQIYQLGNTLIFLNSDGNSAVHIYRYTGTGDPVRIGTADGPPSDFQAQVVGGQLYFLGVPGNPSERTLWVTNGNSVTQFNSITTSIAHFSAFGNGIAYSLETTGNGIVDAEPWTTNNIAPTGVTDSIATYKNYFAIGNVLANDPLDPEGSVRTAQIYTAPLHGTVTLLSSGDYTYNAAAGYSGSDTFYYRIYDGSDYSQPVAVNISVVTPQISDTQSYSTHSNTPLTISKASLLTGSNTLAENPMNINITQMPTKGTLVLSGSGYVYTPNATIGNTTDTFKYVGLGGNTSSNEAIVTITIGNTAPVAVNDSYSVNNNTFLSASVAANDFDAEGDYLFASIVDQTNIHGTLSFNSFTYGFTYIPTANYAGPASFTYRLFDGAAFSNTATVNITVIATTTAVAISDGVYQTYYTSVLNNPALNLFSNDIKPVGSTTHLVTGPSHGSVIVVSDGTFSYTPTVGYQGTDSFTYRINDNGVFSATAQVNLNVIKPVAGNLFVSVDKNTAINVSNLMVSTGDPNATVIATQPLIGIATTGPTAHGVITTTANGFVYTPNTGYVGTDSFTYKVQTSDGLAESITKTAVVTVLDANNVVVVPKTFTVTEDINFQTNSFLTGISVPFSFPDGGLIDPATGLVTSNPIVIAGIGTARLHSFAGTFVFTPAANYSGGDVVLTYRIFPFSDPATYKQSTITIHFTPVNDAPVAVNNSGFQADEDTILLVPISTLLANDTDIDSPASSLSIDPSSLTSGAVIEGAYIKFIPAPNSFGTGNFTYKVTDGLLTSSNSATVSFTISPVEDAPVTNNLTLSVNEDTPLTIFTNISSSDPDGVATAFRPHLITPPQNGTATVTGTNDQIIYTPHLNFVGTDTFTYYVTTTAGDTTIHSNIATATITVNAVNDAPQANADGPYVMNVPVESQITGNVLTNDSDVEGSALTAVLVTAPSAANTQSFVLNANGSFTFVPKAGFIGTESFTYRASDGSLQGNSITVTLIVNDTPSGTANFTVNEDQTDPGLSTISLNLLSNIVDNYHPTGLQVTNFNLISGGSIATLSDPNPLGSIQASLNFDANGIITFSYQVTDGFITSDTINGIINVLAVNDTPSVDDDAYVVNEDGTLNGNVLSNDIDIDSANLTAVLDVGPAHGVLSLNANGSFSYTPAANFFGADQFTYHVNDGSLTSDIAIVSITITPVNDAPVANGDAFVVAEDGALNGNVLSNDTDIDSANLTAVLDVGPAHGILSLNANGSFSYTPNTNYYGADQFTYHTSDGSLNSSIATVSITVTPVNDAPIANNDSYAVAEDGILSVGGPGVLANDSDDSANLTSILESGPAHGTLLSFNSDGSFNYQPNVNFNGVDSFSYRVSDGLLSSIATVTINVTAVNDGPVAASDSYTVDEDGVLNVAAPGVLANDSDIDNANLTAVLASSTTFGTLSFNTNGSFIYTPNTGFYGADSFSYYASDGDLVTDVTTVSIDVILINHAPVASDDSYTVAEDGVLNVNAPGILANDTDINNDGLSAILASGPAHGILALNANGSFSYTPNANFNGSDSFSYRASDGILTSTSIATVTINVTAVNDAPVASNDSYTVAEDGILNVGAPGVLANDTDIDSGSLTAILESGPAHGILSLNSNGSFSYTPNANFNGSDSFSYRASDGVLTSIATTVNINITAVNDAPVASNDSYTVAEDGILNVGAPGVLANDTDIDSAILTAIPASLPSHGTLAFNGDGSFSYIPDPDFNGSDSFSYYASDGSLLSSLAATVTINVTAVNDVPVASNDSYTVAEDGILTGNVLSNDTDIDSATLTAILDVGPAHGILSLNTDGSFSYTPNANYFGADQFTYHANDGSLNSVTATVSITITSVNDAPIANNDSYAVAEDGILSVDAPGVLANDTDIDSANLTAIVDVGPAHGILSLNADGSFSYTPNANYYGADQFTYHANDGSLNSVSATVSITVTPVNDAPIANNDSYEVAEDGILSVDAPGILANDTDIDSANLTAIVDVGPAHGILSLNADGSFSYTPNANYYGADQFTYYVNDGSLDSGIATVSITVTAVNDAPIANNDAYAVDEDGTLNDNVLVNDTDVDNATLTAVLDAGPANGVLTLNADGSFSYTPNANYYGADQFTYYVNDGSLDSGIATVSITVTPVNDAPVANGDVFIVAEDGALDGNVLANDSDIDSANLTAVLNTGPSHGLLTLNADGSFSYNPGADFYGVDQFTYHVNDGSLNSGIATVSINITPVNDAPIAVNNSYTIAEDNILNIASPGVLANDIDIDSGSLTAILESGPAHGILSLNSDGSFSYTPDANFNGSDSFSYHASDGELTSVATVNIIVTAVNDAPVADVTTITTNEDTSIIFSLGSDVEGNSLTVTIISAPTKGGLTPLGGALYRYTPFPNQNGSDSFSFSVSDGTLSTGTVTKGITITPVNDPPVAANRSFNTLEDTALTLSSNGLITASSDPDGIAGLTAILDTQPTKGIISNFNASTGTFVYTPNLNSNGLDTFTYHIFDGEFNSATATVSINVTPVNDVPVADQIAPITTSEDTAVIFTLSGSDIENGTNVTAVISSPASHGTLTALGGGQFRYTPAGDYNGTDSFNYRVRDSQNALSAPLTAQITITAVNDAPVANNDAFVVAEDGALNGNVLTNDTDVDSANLTAVLDAGPAHGTLLLNADGSFSYTPAANFSGSDQFTYHANDGSLDSGIATVSINITPVNGAPIANDDSFTIDEDGTLNGNVLANDTDIDSSAANLTAILDQDVDPAAGVLNLNADGSFDFTPAADFNGIATFQYHVNDGSLDSGIATVSINITSINDAPVANDDSFTIDEDGSLNDNVLANDTDIDSANLTAILDAGPAHGILLFNANGSFSYTPAANFNGADQFTYHVNDGNLDSEIATVSINVTPVNDAPTVDSISASTINDMAVTIPPAGNDVDHDALTYSIIDQTTHGSVTFDLNGNFVYTPAAGFVGNDSFTYQAHDGHLDSSIATVNITVSNGYPINLNPDVYYVAKNNSINVSKDFGLLANDSSSNAALTITSHSAPTHGTITVNADGSFSYKPAPNFLGIDTFTYTVYNGFFSATSTVKLNVVSSSLKVIPDAYKVREDQPLNVVQPGLLLNDVNASPLIVVGSTQPLHGSVVLNSNGSFTYQPNHGYNGKDSFVYTASNAQGTMTKSATVTINVKAVNDYAAAVGKLTIYEGSTNQGTATSLVSGLDGSSRSPLFTLYKQATHGKVTVSADGHYIYRSVPGFVGKDNFIIKVAGDRSDHTLIKISATVVPSLSGQGIPITGFEGVNTGLMTLGSFIDANPGSFAGKFIAKINWGDNTTSSGIVIANNSGGYDVQGSHTYARNNIYHLAISVIDTEKSKVTIKTNAIIAASAPTNINLSNNAVLVTAKNDAVVGNLTAVDNPGDIASFSMAPNGIFKLNNSKIVVADATQLTANTSHVVEITDNNSEGLSLTRSFVINIVDVAPVAIGETYSYSQDAASPATLSINAMEGLLKNDINYSRNTIGLTAALVNGTTHGILTMNVDGSFSYTAANGYSGVDRFTYQVSDGILNSSTATVNININDNPLISSGTVFEHYVAKAAPVILFESFTLTDDNTNYAAGVLRASFSVNGTSDDILSIKQSAQVTTLNGGVYFNGTKIGQYSGGANLNPLQITFNSHATAKAVAAVGSSIAYSNHSATASILDRTVQLTLSDGDGGISSTLYDTIYFSR